MVCHNLKSLIKTTKPYNESTSKYSWGLLYEHTRFAGIQVLLQSIISGSKLLAPRYNKELKYKIEFFVKNNCTHISATPTLWLKIMLVPKSKNLKLSQITLGGEIVTEKILNSLSNYFPKARIVHIFAITEGGVGFSVSDKKPGFPIKFLKEAPNEVKIKIDNGRLFIKNKDVKSKYLESNISFVDSKGWVGTGDMVLIKNDRVFFLGREKGVINVGGEKVYPDEIENILYSHPDVAIAKVYSKSNPITGSIVVADIEPNNSKLNKNKLKESLLKLAGDNLERHKIPVIFRFVSNIKLNQTGKLQRK